MSKKRKTATINNAGSLDKFVLRGKGSSLVEEISLNGQPLNGCTSVKFELSSYGKCRNGRLTLEFETAEMEIDVEAADVRVVRD